MTITIDDVDEQILVRLARNARATYADVGAEVGLSAPAVKRRVDRLLDSGALRGFTTVVDPAAIGWTTEAYVQVFCEGTIAPEHLAAAWDEIPEVVSAATVTGPSDAMLRVVARNVGHLERALERIRETKSVVRSESVIVLSRLVDRAHP